MSCPLSASRCYTVCSRVFTMIALHDVVFFRNNLHFPNMWFQLIFSHCPIQSGKKCLESRCFVIFSCSIRCWCVVVVLTDCLSLCFASLSWCLPCRRYMFFRWASFDSPLRPGFKRIFIHICMTLLTSLVSLSIIWVPVETRVQTHFHLYLYHFIAFESRSDLTL